MGEAEDASSPECGQPQGSLISPTFFSVVIDDLLLRVSKREGMGMQDLLGDIFLWTQGDFTRGITSPKLMLAL